MLRARAPSWAEKVYTKTHTYTHRYPPIYDRVSVFDDQTITTQTGENLAAWPLQRSAWVRRDGASHTHTRLTLVHIHVRTECMRTHIWSHDRCVRAIGLANLVVLAPVFRLN